MSESSQSQLFVKQNDFLGLQRLYGKVVVKYVVILTGTCLLESLTTSKNQLPPRLLALLSESALPLSPEN